MEFMVTNAHDKCSLKKFIFKKDFTKVFFLGIFKDNQYRCFSLQQVVLELGYFHFVTQKGSLDKLACLTNFSPMFHFYTPQKHQRKIFFHHFEYSGCIHNQYLLKQSLLWKH